MNNVPLFVLALLLGGAALLPAVHRWWPARVPQVAFLTAATTSLVWLLAAGFLPLSLTFSEWPVALSLLPWQGLVDEVAWLLSALWLLLLAAALLVSVATSLAPEARRQDANGQPATGETLLWPALEPVRPALQPVLLLLLGATGLIAFWSNSLAGILTGWTLLAAIWILLLLLATPLKESRHGSGERPGHWLVRLGAGLSAPIFLWLAAAALAAALPAAVNRGGLLAEIGQWPLRASAWLLLAAVWQMGIFPVHLWRPLDWHLPPYMAALIHTAPAVAGLSLLIRLVNATDVALSFGLPLTAIGLLGLLAGAVMSWSVTGERLRVVAALALAHASLVLLVGMWAGGEALLVEARVLLIGIGLLFLSAAAQNEPRPAWYVVGPLLAAASLAGLPLTAGFTGRAALYNAWLDDGRFVLVLVSVLLHIPLLATAFYIAWRSRPGAVSGAITPVSWKLGLLPKGMALPEHEKWPGLLAAVALLLPAITLITPSRLAFAEVRFVTWLAILAPVAAGAVLLRYLPLLREGQLALRQVVDLDFPLAWLYQNVGRALAAAGSALREAATVLEGEGGMLWLIVLLVILWLAWLG
jgi:hypothetical protein